MQAIIKMIGSCAYASGGLRRVGHWKTTSRFATPYVGAPLTWCAAFMATPSIIFKYYKQYYLAMAERLRFAAHVLLSKFREVNWLEVGLSKTISFRLQFCLKGKRHIHGFEYA